MSSAVVGMPPADGDKPLTGTKLFSFLTLDDIDTLPDPEWLVDKLVPAEGLVVPYGAPKSFKSFLAMSMALHVAAGMDWTGRKVRQGGVIYIAGEGKGGLKLRFRAMRQHYGIPSGIPFWAIDRAVNFTDAGLVDTLTEEIEDLMQGSPVAMVVIDTLARAMPGSDENAARDMTLVVSICDKLKQRLRCTVVPVHHTGKDSARGMRGSNALLGAVDTSFTVTRDKRTNIVTLTTEAQKDEEEAAPIHFNMVKVPLGDGRSSLVPVVREGLPASAVALQEEEDEVRLKPAEKRSLDALEEALRVHGVDRPDGTRACGVEQWRQVLYGRMAGEKQGTKQQAFTRGRDALLGYRRIVVADPDVWLKPVWTLDALPIANGAGVGDLKVLFGESGQTTRTVH